MRIYCNSLFDSNECGDWEHPVLRTLERHKGSISPHQFEDRENNHSNRGREIEINASEQTRIDLPYNSDRRCSSKCGRRPRYSHRLHLSSVAKNNSDHRIHCTYNIQSTKLGRINPEEKERSLMSRIESIYYSLWSTSRNIKTSQIIVNNCRLSSKWQNNSGLSSSERNRSCFFFLLPLLLSYYVSHQAEE